jgi:hypothetical protein
MLQPPRQPAAEPAPVGRRGSARVGAVSACRGKPSARRVRRRRAPRARARRGARRAVLVELHVGHTTFFTVFNAVRQRCQRGAFFACGGYDCVVNSMLSLWPRRQRGAYFAGGGEDAAARADGAVGRAALALLSDYAEASAVQRFPTVPCYITPYPKACLTRLIIKCRIICTSRI